MPQYIQGTILTLLYSKTCLFVCFVALHPKSTDMVMAGRSVHLPTLFAWQAWTGSQPVLHAHTFACNWKQPFLNDSVEGRRMIVEIISWSISKKVWDRAGIELATTGSAVRLASVARHVTDCATRPSSKTCVKPLNGQSKIDKTKVLMTTGSLMKVESTCIAECSLSQYFWPALSHNWSWKSIFVLFESGCFTQVYCINFCRTPLVYNGLKGYKSQLQIHYCCR